MTGLGVSRLVVAQVLNVAQTTVVRGAWDGCFSKSWRQACVHLALPRTGRPLKPEQLQPID